MANDYLSEWREGLEPMLYWEMLLAQLKEQFWHRETVVHTLTPRTLHWAVPLSALLCSWGWHLYPLCLMLRLLSSLSTDDQPINIAPASAWHPVRPKAVLGSVEFLGKHLAGLCEINCKAIQHVVRWLGFGHLPFPCHHANSRVIVPVWITSITSQQP